MTRRVALAVLALLGTLAPAPSARADDSEEIVLGTVGAGLVLSDLAFFVRDVALVAGGSEADVGVSIAEAAVTTPQAAFFHTGLAVIAHDAYGYETVPLVLPTSMITALMAHGYWSAVQPDGDPARRFGACTVIGIDAAWATLAISHSAGGELPMQDIAPWMLGTTAPGLVLSVGQAFVDETFRTGWVATSVSSGALVAYAVAGSLGAFEPDDTAEDYASARRLAPSLRLLPWAPPPLTSASSERRAGLALVGWF